MKWKMLIIWMALLAIGVLSGKYLFKGKVRSAAPPPVKLYEAQGGGAHGLGGTDTSLAGFEGNILEVHSGDEIQDAVKRAVPGDLIRVYPGKYKETVYIDKDDISFQGIIIEGEWPTLDGEKELNDAFLYSGNGIVIENFKIINYKGNGIMGQAGNNFVIRNNWVVDAGVYGIFPEFGKNGLIEHNVLSGIEDAAIYVGMCDNIDVLHNETYESVAGIEIENSRHCLVENNYTHDNTGGLLVFITPGLPIKTCFDIIVRNNFVVNNNHENFGAPGSIVAGIPKGTGILIMAADDVTLEGNTITGNNNAGITITDLTLVTNVATDPESDPNPDRLVILDNFMSNNGKDPGGELKALMLTQMETQGPDIIAIGGGGGSCILDKDKFRTFGLGDFGQCQMRTSVAVQSFILAKPVEPRDITIQEKGKLTFYGVCSGCHAYDIRMIGPPTRDLQAIYNNNPQGIVDYITNPVHRRENYPEMPPQDYLSEETRMAVA
ncbi:MAG: right-handed parallel beta-helix repeat-containing protein, partial [Flavobacteriales bacterium]|nr:right-handed parallel beta-helix repeat-containing protein [Flavobacteriales bacterium]